MQSYDLDKTLISFSADKSADWTIREAVEGVQIFGGIGSGKTSGSGRTLALKYLSNDFGGLVLTAKPDEKDLWIDYCKQTNRLNDLIIVEPDGKHYFNFLDYESSYKVGGISITENIVQVLKTVIESSEAKSSGKENDSFWANALDMLIFNVIDLCKMAYGTVSIEQMYNIVQTAPKSHADFLKEPKLNSCLFALNLAHENLRNQTNVLFESLSEDDLEQWTNNDEFKNKLIFEKIPDANLFLFLDQFFVDTYVNLSGRTRAIIEFSFSGFLFRLMKEPLFSLFCRHPSTFTPEDSLNGKIILLNLPVKLYFKVGRDIQVMFKYIWQRAMERRNIKENGRPLFLWADEAQHFLHSYDADYQATARSSRIATVYISQNLSNYHANMGGESSDHRVKSFLGTLGTKIFHANADIETNTYGSNLIGENYTANFQVSNTMAGEFSSSKTVTAQLEKMVRPEKFNMLKNGSDFNNGVVEGYMHRQGRLFPNKANYMKIIFNQNKLT